MLPEERAAASTITGLSAQLQELDYQEPKAFERALEIARELDHIATVAIRARVTAEDRVPLFPHFAAAGLLSGVSA